MKRLLFHICITLFIVLSSCASINQTAKYDKIRNRTEKAYFGSERDSCSLAFIDMGEAIVAASYSSIEKGEIPADLKEHIELIQVDDIPVSNEKQVVPPKRCSILPGKHTIEVYHGQWVFLDFTIGRYLVTFEAEAGKTYSIKSDTDHEKREVDVYVIDIESGERIPSSAEHKFTLRENSDKSQNTIQYQNYYHQVPSSRKPSRNAYAGPKQKNSSLAFIKRVDPPLNAKTDNLIKFIQVDTIPVANIKTSYNKIGILPGIHTIAIEQIQKKGNVNFLLESYLVTFDAKVGKTYIINVDTAPETNVVDVYVTNTDSGNRIASTVDYKYRLKEKE